MRPVREIDIVERNASSAPPSSRAAQAAANCDGRGGMPIRIDVMSVRERLSFRRYVDLSRFQQQD
jgi:hypothetical protein